jgi:hypothetical protein
MVAFVFTSKRKVLAISGAIHRYAFDCEQFPPHLYRHFHSIPGFARGHNLALSYLLPEVGKLN